MVSPRAGADGSRQPPAQALLLVLLGEQPVQAAARLGEQLECLPTLGLGPSDHDLGRGDRDLLDQTAQLKALLGVTTGGLGPRLAEGLAVVLYVVAAGIGERVLTACADDGGLNQALVLELGQRRVG